MRDEIESRLWVEHGPAFTAAVTELVRQARVAWSRLHEIQYDAPWRREAPRTGGKRRAAGCHSS